MTIEFRPLSDALGAEAVGVKLADDNSDETIAEIREGWLQHKILLFRGQDLSVERQSAFARSKLAAMPLHGFQSTRE